MASKSKFVGVRLEPVQQRKLIRLAVLAGEPGNLSAGIRWALDRAGLGEAAATDGIDRVGAARCDNDKEEASNGY